MPGRTAGNAGDIAPRRRNDWGAQRGVKKEARAIEELLRSTELFEKDAAQNR